MKTYTELFNDLYLLDMNGFPFNDDDFDLAIRFNLHRQYFSVGDTPNHFVLIGTKGGLDGFVANYKLNHRKYGKKVNESISFAELIKENL